MKSHRTFFKPITLLLAMILSLLLTGTLFAATMTLDGAADNCLNLSVGDSYPIAGNLRINGQVIGDDDFYSVGPYTLDENDDLGRCDFLIWNDDWTVITATAAGTCYISFNSRDTSFVEMNEAGMELKVVITEPEPETETEITPARPAINTVIKDTKTNGRYKITSENTVTLIKPISTKETSFTVPSTVTLNDYSYQVTAIARKAFYKNTSLKSITIGKKVSSIGAKAFYGCKNLKKVIIKTTKLTSKTVGSYAFKSIHKKAVITVPSKKLKSYKALLKKKGISGKYQKIKK